MSAFLKIFAASLAVLSVAACAHKVDTTSDDIDKQIEQMKRDNEKRQADIDAQTAAATRESGAALLKSLESLKDSEAGGSQPSYVFVSGAFVQKGALVPAITINLKTGIGWRGTSPALTAVPFLSDKYTPRLKPDGHGFMNFGCQDRGELTGLTETQPLRTDKDETTYDADVVMICDAKLLEKGSIVIRAKRLILEEADFERTTQPSSASSFAIIANSIELRGTNVIASHAQTGPITIVAGPMIQILVGKLAGHGTLAISSEGSSFSTAQ